MYFIVYKKIQMNRIYVVGSARWKFKYCMAFTDFERDQYPLTMKFGKNKKIVLGILE